MRFLLCASDRGTGDVVVVSGHAYATRREALDAITVGLAQGLGDSELFIVDLEAATPVVMFAGAPAAAAGFGADPVAGASPEPEPGLEPEAGRAPSPAEEWPFVSSDIGGVGPSTLIGDRIDEDADRTQLWWLEAGSVAEPEDVSQVIEADSAEPRVETDERSEETLPGSAEPAIEEPPNDEIGNDQPPGVVESWSEPTAGSGTARVDFEAWTCSDCIFIETCPKTESERPATCGSFQWKPE